MQKPTLLHDDIVNETSSEHLTPWRRIQHLLERQRPVSPLAGEESRRVEQEERQVDLPPPDPPIVEEGHEGATSDLGPDRESKIGEQTTRSASSAAEPATDDEMPKGSVLNLKASIVRGVVRSIVGCRR